MKKMFLLAIATVTMLASFAQSEKYTKAMEQQLTGYDTTRNPESLQQYANAFERIAEAEKTQWLAYYYAALSNVNLGYSYAFSAGPLGGNADKVDPLADKAEGLLNKADGLNKNSSEIYAVKKMIASLRMMADVMNRYMTYGAIASEALETAKKLNPENPRVYLLEAIDQFNTPEEYGGSKVEAKKLFELAKQKYAAYKPESTIHPTWGTATADYYLSQLK